MATLSSQAGRVKRPRPLIGCTLWTGPSRITGEPIAALASFRTENPKTGDMVQTWIVRADMPPLEASQSDAEAAVCGDCPLRGVVKDGHAIGRACYVNLFRGVGQTWRNLQAGSYPPATAAMLWQHVRGRPVRLGSYGDPTAVPLFVWLNLLGYAQGYSGYTHHWRQPENQEYRHLIMASVESGRERLAAKKLGWRTYRIRLDGDPIMPGEIVCPASPDGGYRRVCQTCLACDGADREGKVDVTIIAHGTPPTVANLTRIINRARARRRGR